MLHTSSPKRPARAADCFLTHISETDPAPARHQLSPQIPPADTDTAPAAPPPNASDAPNATNATNASNASNATVAGNAVRLTLIVAGTVDAFDQQVNPTPNPNPDPNPNPNL